jgi:inosose dehydratase
MGADVQGPDVSRPAPFRVGTAPVNWNNFDLEDWRPVVPFPRILDEMRAAGYVATEWDASFGTGISTLNQERGSRGMAFTGAYRWLDFLNDDQFDLDLAEIRPFLDTLQGIGVKDLIVADSLRPHRVACAGSVPMDGSESLNPAGYDRIVANLQHLHEVVTPFGLFLHYHNHVGSYIETPAEVEELLSRLDLTFVDLCFDTGHFAFGGGDALKFVEAHASAIGYLHLKDVDGKVLAEARAAQWSFLDALRHYIFCPLGEGDAGIPAILDKLIDNEFNNYVIIEQDTCRGDQTDNARHNLDMVQRIVTNAQSRGIEG